MPTTIAYAAHDLDDGLRAGLFDLKDLTAVPFLAGLLDEIETLHPGLEPARIVHELARRVITRFVEDVIRESERRIAALAPATVADIHAAGAPVIAFSPTIEAADAEVMRFLWKRMYRDASVVAVREKAAAIVTDLFTAFKPPGADAPGMERRPRRSLRATNRPPHRGLYRRHDRHLRRARAPQAVRRHARASALPAEPRPPPGGALAEPALFPAPLHGRAGMV